MVDYSCKVEDYTSITAGRKATGRKNIKLFVLEVVGLQSFVSHNGGSVFADLRGVEDQIFLALNICPNELKLHM